VQTLENEYICHLRQIRSRGKRYISSFDIICSSLKDSSSGWKVTYVWFLTTENVNNLLMEPHLDPHISGIEPYWALKLGIPREMFVKNQNLKGC